MSYPPRPPLMPTVPYAMTPSMVPMPMATHMLSMGGVGAYGRTGRTPLLPVPGSTNQRELTNGRDSRDHNAQPVTVFVGNITTRAPDMMMKLILQTFGPVLNWKRISAFGFCEFANPEAGLRCVRLLHDMELGGKKLVAKVDEKTKLLVDKYKTEQREKLSGDGGERDRHGGAINPEDYMDDAQRALDQNALHHIQQLTEQYKDEMNNYEIIQKEEQIEKTNRVLEEADIEEEKRDVIHREIGKFRETMKEEAKEVVGRKRDEPRDKDREREKEKEKEKERERDRDRDRERDDRKDRRRDDDKDKDRRHRRTRSRSKEREREREREKEREREREKEKERVKEREREKEKEREREREREREWERERDRERERERERDREREAPEQRQRAARSSADSRREKEMEEESRDRKRAEKRAREKEAAYQERLRNWESRERHKAKEYEKEKEKERCREEEREKEAKRLKEFLEDYEDERDDVKYYKGKELQRRLAARVREADNDARDREKETEDLEKLKREVFGEKPEDDASAIAAFEKAKQQQEELYKPKILIDVNLEQSQQREREEHRARQREEARKEAREREARHRERYLQDQATRELPEEAEPIESDSSDGAVASPPPPEPVESAPDTPEYESPQPVQRHHSHYHRHHKRRRAVTPNPEEEGSLTPPPPASPPIPSNTPTPPQNNLSAESSPVSISMNVKQQGISLSLSSGRRLSAASPTLNSGSEKSGKKRKLGVHEVFNTHDSDSDEDRQKSHHHKGHKRKQPPVPIDYGEEPKDKKDRSEQSDNTEPTEPKSKSKDKSSKEKRAESKSVEEKRKNIKSLIDKIPTQKDALFGFKLDTSQIDSVLMEKKIRPWINKKIIEYIGEPEPTLVDFICSKVLAGSQPQGILDDVQMVLDEEAEVFVVKMWRLLIYEVEAKKLGLVK